LEQELEYKDRLVQSLQEQVTNHEEELERIKNECDDLRAEKDIAEERMRKAQNVFRYGKFLCI
jgi:peptidoglycan hydrolase CwlO-like protein